MNASPFQGSKRLTTLGTGSAVLGALTLAWGWAVSPRQAFFSYVAAFATVLSLALGMLVFLMIGHLMRAYWLIIVRRLAEAVVATLPLLALLFIPILAGVQMYPWAHGSIGPHETGVEHMARVLSHKRPYLNIPFFAVRALVYFAAWMVLAHFLRRWSLSQDVRGDDAHVIDELKEKQFRLSAAGVPALALTFTFAAFDWLMSLDPAWYSAVFGIYYFAGGFLGSVALLVIIAHLAGRSGAVSGVTPYHFHALGRLLLAFVIFWAYIAFFQAFLVQIANKPEEVTWYLARTHGTWKGVGLALIIGHFAIPFLILLSKGIKFRSGLLASVACWLLVMHYVDLYWVVLPSLHVEGIRPHVLDLGALLLVGGSALLVATWRQRGYPLVPTGDPALAASLGYRSAL